MPLNQLSFEFTRLPLPLQLLILSIHKLMKQIRIMYESHVFPLRRHQFSIFNYLLYFRDSSPELLNLRPQFLRATNAHSAQWQHPQQRWPRWLSRYEGCRNHTSDSFDLLLGILSFQHWVYSRFGSIAEKFLWLETKIRIQFANILTFSSRPQCRLRLSCPKERREQLRRSSPTRISSHSNPMCLSTWWVLGEFH